MYLWPNSTLVDIIDQLKLKLPQAQDKNAKFRFSSIYKDFKGNFKRKDLGMLLIQVL